MKIAITGNGYVGLSNAILLAQHHDVVALVIVHETVELLDGKNPPIEDKEIENFLAHKPLNFRVTLDKVDAYVGDDYVNIDLPPTSRTVLKLVKSVKLEQDGYETKQIHQ